jgi:7-keto-8-aminopelargonate synthetase-like enzyme
MENSSETTNKALVYPAPHLKPLNQIPVGNNISERAAKFLNSQPKYLPKNKTIPSIPRNLNFGISDHLSISNNPGTMLKAVEAIQRFGTHSGGSPLFYGVNLLTRKLVATFEEWLNNELYSGKFNADRAKLRNYKEAYSAGKEDVKDSSTNEDWKGYFSYYSNGFLARFAVSRSFSSKQDIIFCEKGIHRAIIDGINAS